VQLNICRSFYFSLFGGRMTSFRFKEATSRIIITLMGLNCCIFCVFFHEENSKFPFVLELGYLFLRDLRVYLISVVHCLATSVSNGIRSLRAVSFLSLYQLFIAIPLSVCKRKFSGTLSTIKTLLRSLPILLRSLIYTPKLKLVCYLYNLCLIVLLLSNMSNTLRNTKS